MYLQATNDVGRGRFRMREGRIERELFLMAARLVHTGLGKVSFIGESTGFRAYTHTQGLDRTVGPSGYRERGHMDNSFQKKRKKLHLCKAVPEHFIKWHTEVNSSEHCEYAECAEVPFSVQSERKQ